MGAVSALNRRLICSIVSSPIVRGRRFWNQEVKVGEVPLTLMNNQQIFLSCPHDLMLSWPRGVSFREKSIYQEITASPLNWRLRPPPDLFGLLMALNQQRKKGIIVWAMKINPDYQSKSHYYYTV